MGGTFDPVHLGHLVMAEDAREAFALDEVLWIPSNVSPHKQGRAIASAEHRLEMIERAIAGNPHFRASDIEMRRGGVSYTVDTLRLLREEYPGDEWFFIMGVDSLLELRTWKEIGNLLEVCRFVTVARPGHGHEGILPESLGLPLPAARQLLKDMLRGHFIDISSTEVRQRVRSGKSIRYLVPAAVADYIHERHLYTEERP